jgi:hypothetical protein
MRELTQREQDTLAFLGNFGPTVIAQERMIKGWMADSDGDVVKAYLDSKYLRAMAQDLASIAQWLDERSVQDPGEAV